MHRLSLIAAVGFCLVAACGKNDAAADARNPAQGGQAERPAGVAQPKGALPPGAIQVQKVQIMDPGGFGRPMIAATALVPPGWRMQGGVVWAQNIACAEPATFAWSAVAPDGVTSIELFPLEIWAAGTNGPGQCMPGDYTSVRAYLESYVQRRFPGSRPLDYRPRRDFLDAGREYFALKQQMFQGVGINVWNDAGELLYAHQQGGVDVRGVVAASATFYASELPNPMGGPPLRSLNAQTSGTFAARAPSGQLNLKQVEMMRKSIVPDPAWVNRMFEHTNKLAGIQTQGVKDRAAIIVAGGAAMTRSTIEANQAATQGYASREATNDRIQRESIEVIRGVETYDEPVEGGTVQLDNTYDHAWRMRNGSYVLTDDPSFNPNLTLGMEGQELQRTR